MSDPLVTVQGEGVIERIESRYRMLLRLRDDKTFLEPIECDDTSLLAEGDRVRFTGHLTRRRLACLNGPHQVGGLSIDTIEVIE